MQQNIEGLYCTSHVYRIYKQTFEIKAGLNRNTKNDELWSSVQSEQRRKEGNKAQASDWSTGSGADRLNREVFKETKLITENATNSLAQYTTICIHVSNLLILVLRHTKEKSRKNSVFTFQFHAMQFFSLFRACNSSWFFCKDVSNAL